MTITTVLVPPLPTDSTATFNTKAFAFVDALANDWTDEVNATAAAVNANATASTANAASAATSAGAAHTDMLAAAASAASAAASYGAPLWVTGTAYALGATAWSPITYRVYRRIIAGAGATDPSADATNWALAFDASLNAEALYLFS